MFLYARHPATLRRNLQWIAGCCLFVLCLAQQGCIPFAVMHAEPVSSFNCLNVGWRDGIVPIDYALLGQPRPKPRRFAVGDVVSVYIQGVLPSGVTEIPVITRGESFTQIYYPPDGSIRTPSFGVPLEITESGTITLPFIGDVQMVGRTVDEATEYIRQQYVAKQLLKEERERIYVTLIKEGVRRVVIFREDTPIKSPTFVTGFEAPFTKIGNGQVIDLPVYQNDVLHALAASGGLPGIDAVQELFVVRRQNSANFDPAMLGESAGVANTGNGANGGPPEFASRTDAIRIPLIVLPGVSLEFTLQDVILEDGDTIYLPKREEYFYTAGLLPGRRVPLPRDQDTDILEAITLAAGNVGEPTGITGAGPGNVVTPSLAVIVRKMPNGDQCLIKVDLHKALLESSERVVIQPGDVVMLQYRCSEAALNFALNFFGFGFGVTPNDF